MTLPADPGPRCDFCAGFDPLWIYPADDFPMSLVVSESAADELAMDLEVSRGGWCACAACSQNIDAESYDQLLKRAMTTFLLVNPNWDQDLPALSAIISSNHAGFRVNRTGDKAGFG